MTRTGRAKGRPSLQVLLGLTALVGCAHVWLVGQVLPNHLGAGAGDSPPRMAVAFVRELAAGAGDSPPRMAVAFVRELAPAAPAAVAAPAPPARPVQRARAPVAAPEPAASAPLPAEAAPEPAPSLPAPEASAPDITAALAQAAPSPEAAASADTVVSAETVPAAPAASAAASAATAAAPAFDWPPSTRLSYRLSGNFRGPVEGRAQVEWLRSGTRYQVHLDVSVGPAFAPLMRRRISSEGEVTVAGLRPERFDEETRMLWRDARSLRIEMGPELVRLARGEPWARPAGLQDTASQFVQLTWLFTTQPGLLQAGQTIPLPLALPRRIQLWQYEVGASESLDTPAGPVQAVHVRPRPDAASEARRGGDLVPEAWFAPSLQYLPVRIFIRQDAENYIDLLLERLPQQAEAGR